MASKDDAPTKDELLVILNKCESGIERIVIVTAGYLGMRASEITHMIRDWIDFQGNYVNVPSIQKCKCNDCTKQDQANEEAIKMAMKLPFPKKKVGYWSPKTKKGARPIYLRSTARPTIEGYFSINNKISIKGQRPITRQTVRNIVKRVVKRTDLTKQIYPHSLRATAAQMWADENLPPTALMGVMGWSKIETANRYIKADKDMILRECRRVCT